jgi:hypothetical protein
VSRPTISNRQLPCCVDLTCYVQPQSVANFAKIRPLDVRTFAGLYEEVGTEYTALMDYCDFGVFLREFNTHARTNG